MEIITKEYLIQKSKGIRKRKAEGRRDLGKKQERIRRDEEFQQT